jgi:hypothetical protein
MYNPIAFLTHMLIFMCLKFFSALEKVLKFLQCRYKIIVR